ncbi:uncharacterized protein SCHCODRAFT_02590397 [Schizophyllum commune H4-8]|nr:uncharacterized protein SCHCODRAFT_02590397 [Schizophyllum commune H4-8]KAI5886959.1 hypothetical protein SCHCODRAFT_02590397 [Schizophyllum commune H4-8]
MEYFEYHWGLDKGELDLSTPLNHIQLRSDMVECLNDADWTLLPTKKILDAMVALSDFNKTTDLNKRKRFTEILPEQEYEYEFLPMRISQRDRPQLYLKRGSTTRTIKRAYSRMPCIRSRAHPLFVSLRAYDDIHSGYDSMPEAKMDRLQKMLANVLWRWDSHPPVEFLVGPDVWQKHRHPSSDDGFIARALLSTCKRTDTKKPVRRVWKSSRAPAPQSKTRQKGMSVYDHARQPPPHPSSPVLPRSVCASEAASTVSDADVHAHDFSPADLRQWLDSINSQTDTTTRTQSPASSGRDSVLARYRKEPARNPVQVRLTTLYHEGGLLGGRDCIRPRSVFCSNLWARHNYQVCLWSSTAAQFSEVNLIP